LQREQIPRAVLPAMPATGVIVLRKWHEIPLEPGHQGVLRDAQDIECFPVGELWIADHGRKCFSVIHLDAYPFDTRAAVSFQA
jgi:hypothetical protein